MKVLAFVTDAYGGHGGIAKVNRDLLAALADHPSVDRVIAIPRRVDRPLEPVPSGVDFRAGAVAGPAAYAGEVARGIASRDIGLVLCGHVNLTPVAWVARALTRAPVLLVIHGAEAWEPLPRSLRSLAARRMDAVLAVSRFTLDRFRSWMRPHPASEFVVPNAVDLSRFAPGPKADMLERRFGLRGRLVLLTLGRLEASERAKGFDQMFGVLPALAKEHPDVTYVVAGEGNDRERLEGEARRLGLADRVVFTGAIPEESKADLYRTADLYVMPSRLEGFGLVYVEALASGLRVVGSSVDGSRAALLDGRLGELVDPDDPADILRGIRAALAKPKGVVPRELDDFSIAAYRKRIHDVVDALVGRRGSA